MVGPCMGYGVTAVSAATTLTAILTTVGVHNAHPGGQYSSTSRITLGESFGSVKIATRKFGSGQFLFEQRWNIDSLIHRELYRHCCGGVVGSEKCGGVNMLDTPGSVSQPETARNSPQHT